MRRLRGRRWPVLQPGHVLKIEQPVFRYRERRWHLPTNRSMLPMTSKRGGIVAGRSEDSSQRLRHS